jgi:hypothetical protein
MPVAWVGINKMAEPAVSKPILPGSWDVSNARLLIKIIIIYAKSSRKILSMIPSEQT